MRGGARQKHRHRKRADFPLGVCSRIIYRSRLRYSSNAFTTVSSIFPTGVPVGKNLPINSVRPSPVPPDSVFLLLSEIGFISTGFGGR